MIEAQYITLDDRLCYIESCGSGPPVVCIHTAGQSGVQWRETLLGLSQAGFRVIVPDLPGHGRSEPAAGGPIRSLSDYADWCIRLFDALELKRPFVMGCSIGGRITLDIATKIGDDLAGIIAMAAKAQSGGYFSVAGLERGREDAASPSRTDRTYYGTIAACGRNVSPERVALIATMHRREDPEVTTSDLIGWFSHDISASVSSISCPTYVVVGDDDFWLDLEQVRWTSAQIPNCRTLVLEGVGHYPMEEMEDFPTLAATWLQNLSEPTTRSA